VDAHAILGVPADAGPQEVRAAYLRRVRRCHPDLGRDEADRRRRTRATVALNVAYAELRKGPGTVAATRRERPPAAEVATDRGWRPSRAWRSTIGAALGVLAAALAAQTITGDPTLSAGIALLALVARHPIERPAGGVGSWW
jgi:hypothetical protein